VPEITCSASDENPDNNPERSPRFKTLLQVSFYQPGEKASKSNKGKCNKILNKCLCRRQDPCVPQYYLQDTPQKSANETRQKSPAEGNNKDRYHCQRNGYRWNRFDGRQEIQQHCQCCENRYFNHCLQT